jgi:hypothetical protein
MRAVHFSHVRGGDYFGRMRSVIRTNPLARAGAAFLVGGLAVLVVHQPVFGLLHALGCTPITPYSHRATHPWGVPVFLSLSFWGASGPSRSPGYWIAYRADGSIG